MMVYYSDGKPYFSFPRTTSVCFGGDEKRVKVTVRMGMCADRSVLIEQTSGVCTDENGATWQLTNTSERMGKNERVEPIKINQLNKQHMLDYTMKMLTGKLLKKV